jgi:hypothetical protein
LAPGSPPLTPESNSLGGQHRSDLLGVFAPDRGGEDDRSAGPQGVDQPVGSMDHLAGLLGVDDHHEDGVGASSDLGVGGSGDAALGDEALLGLIADVGAADGEAGLDQVVGHAVSHIAQAHETDRFGLVGAAAVALN